MIGGARYLVRFDDICPGMNWQVWREIEKILADSDVRPMLAVVPSNEDPTLDVAPKEPHFWQHVRDWQARGWTIGLHGYQHRYVTPERGLIGINARSEFAGLPAAEQRDKLRRAVEIFAAEGVRPDVWIAPGHSFDDATVAALHDLGVGAISDGFFFSAHRDRRGMLWVPQQIWSFRPRPFGLWTVCYHHNDWSAGDVRRFAADVAAYRARITSFAEVSGAPHIRERSWTDTIVSTVLLSTLNAKRRLRATLDRATGKGRA
jgi:peptidoglycan/xylan/chitin deacetylase (PgdA/CDA1 family)